MEPINLGKKRNIASFDVDCQYAFTPECPDELPVPNALEIVSELNSQAELAQIRVGSKEAHSQQAKWVATDANPQLTPIEAENMDVHWNVHAVPGTKGFESIAGIPPVTEYDFFVWKGMELDMHPYGSCYHDFANKLSTGVIEFLKQNDITTVIVGGLATDYCVKNTVLQLLTAGFNTIVNLGACRALDPETEKAAIAEIKANGGAVVSSHAELISE